ncbi:hypothetical protein GPECTOR_54g224 [Gonium pectorale]|uniref:DUF2252 domain-containing protein n=1 Tax=Gonium pectorale TaxID=33097 RepID=A0A150G6T4_GONPE|nr:hypothetical protein GPECTOR_54g224 [Gonium pectorale]|eukprot:KXZ45483.1 hypothetical protein GPECTOR_54g224 [Gonium pectorale]
MAWSSCARAGALLAILLGLAASADALYTLQGGSTQGALLRQSDNEKHLQAAVQDVEHVDCVAKFEAMNVSPFTFYRGSNQLYYRDLADQKLITRSAFYDPHANPWIQGDMHVLNAGRFDNDKGIVVYDLNDFDEAFVANYLYDVYRLASSIILVARNNSMHDDEAVSCVETFAVAYREQLKKLAKDEAEPLSLDAKSSRGLKMLSKWTRVNRKGQREFDTESEDLEAVSEEEWRDISDAMGDYVKKTVTSPLRGDTEYFAVQDIARRRNAGTGSLGTQRYYILIAGDSAKDSSDDRILDAKLQGRPSIYPYLTQQQQDAVYRAVANDADRAVRAYLSLIARADDHLGYLKLSAGYFSVRERSPYKKSLDLTSGVDKAVLDELAEQYGIMLANAHARSDKGNEALGAPKSFEGLVEHDYALFLDSLRTGQMCPAAAQ